MFPEQRLWIAVIVRAFEDYKALLGALTRQSIKHNHYVLKKTFNELVIIENQFRTSHAKEFCDYVGVSPARVIKELYKLKNASGLDFSTLKITEKFRPWPR